MGWLKSMQRRVTKTTRGPNAEEKRFQSYVKHSPCCWCGSDAGSIVDHCRGSTWRHLKTLCGHWFCIPQCLNCDTKKTIHGKRNGNESQAWLLQLKEYEAETGRTAPIEVVVAISDWNR